MFIPLHSDSADDLWVQAANWFHSGGIANVQGSRAGNTREVLHAALSLENPRQRWIASREPAMNPAFAIAEVIWIITGRNDSAFLNYFNRRLPEFAGKGETYHGAYGFRLRKAFDIDQLKQAASALRGQQNSRQVVLQIWQSKIDFPQQSGKAVSEDVPCNIVSMLKVRDGKLEWTQIMRSNDLFLGLPHNLIQFTTLQEVLAGWIGVQPGAYQHLSDSLHLYERDEYVLQQIVKQPCPPNNDQLNLPEIESEQGFKQLANVIEKIICPKVSSEELLQYLNHATLPKVFFNFLAVLIAEGCRRRQNMEDTSRAIKTCENACLTFLWQRWLDRCSANPKNFYARSRL
jgi:thymidylate synthase